MKKNLIIRKRHLLSITMLVIMLGLGGCTPQLTTQTYTHETGEEPPTDVSVYAEFENQEQKTTAPKWTFTNLAATVGIDGVVTADSFEIESTYVSEVKIGFRKAELIKTEDELKTILSEAIASMDKYAEVNVGELLGLSWEKETDTWYESNVAWENLNEEFVPNENGLYQLELVSADLYGNADVLKCYVLADLVAPVFTVDSELEVTRESDMDANEFMKMLQKEISAEDNILGDVSYSVNINGTEFIKENGNSVETKVNCTVSDLAGNTTTLDYVFKVNVIKQTVVQQQKTTVVNGHDRERAEQAFALVNQQRTAAGLHELAWDESLYEFACVRTTQIVTDFSHNFPDGTGVSAHLLYNVGEANGYGENIARNYKSINNLINGWMNSQGHKENILDSRYTAGVMACYCCNGTYYWVNLFKAQ